MMRDGEPWTEEEIATIRRLWAAGDSAGQIGRQMDRSKNSIVGKAHRLGLEGRPNPTRPRGSGANPRKPRVGRTTLPPLQSVAAPAATVLAPARSAPAPVTTRPVANVPPAPAPRPPVPSPLPTRAAAPEPYKRIVSCCWPIGEPGTRSFRFCEAGSVPGKPYCPEHCALAFVRVRDRREDGLQEAV